MVRGAVLDTLADDIQVVEFGAQGAGNGPGGARVFPGQHFGGPGRVVIRTRFDPSLQQKTIALGQRLRMRIDHANFVEAGFLGGQQAMVDRHFDLTRHLQVGGGEQIVDLGDGSFKGILNRHDPQVEVATADPSEHIDKLETGNKRAIRHQTPGRHLTVGAVFPLESHQFPVFFLETFALLNDGSQQLPGK